MTRPPPLTQGPGCVLQCPHPSTSGRGDSCTHYRVGTRGMLPKRWQDRTRVTPGSGCPGPSTPATRPPVPQGSHTVAPKLNTSVSLPNPLSVLSLALVRRGSASGKLASLPQSPCHPSVPSLPTACVSANLENKTQNRLSVLVLSHGSSLCFSALSLASLRLGFSPPAPGHQPPPSVP